ncbi:MAG: Gfo/Idh/MocA family oxidoreductase [Lachnospiraceae bacterium]|jgi:predicted dehydrogenase|nr:Gfo/Idh/MocA family oxidoreductase [Lachnospiraceae bacterium]
MTSNQQGIKAIGLIDYYLDEWHANHYPQWIHQLSNGCCEAAYAYAQMDAPSGGRSTQQWCADMQIQRCETIAELIQKSDYIMVLSPDHPQMHWSLCQEALRSGKRVYVDKTFAPTAQIARDLFALAQEHHTPMWSSSALRFSKECMALPEKEAEMIVLSGPGKPENYLIHQAEPMVRVLKSKALRIQGQRTESAFHFTVEFENGKLGLMSLLDGGDFVTSIKYRDGEVKTFLGAEEMFERLLLEILRFFETGKVPVDQEETLEIAKILEAARQAEQVPGKWVTIA